MNKNITYFETLQSSENFCISDTPWIGYINEKKAVIWSEDFGQLKKGVVIPGQVVVLRGSTNPGGSWDEKWAIENQIPFVNQGDTAALTIHLTSQPEAYEFKLVENGIWLTNYGWLFEDSGSAVLDQTGGYDNNVQLYATISGDYTFTWNFDLNTLFVQYPAESINTVTFVNSEYWGTESGTTEIIEYPIYVYMFNSVTQTEKTSWPGDIIYPDIEQEYDHYIYSVEASNSYDTIIFNNGQGLQTLDLPIINNAYYTQVSDPSNLSTEYPSYIYEVVGDCSVCGQPWAPTESSVMQKSSAGMYTWEALEVTLYASHPATIGILRNGSTAWAGGTHQTLGIEQDGIYNVNVILDSKTGTSYIDLQLVSEIVATPIFKMATSLDWETPIEMTVDTTTNSASGVLNVTGLTESQIIEFCIFRNGDAIKGYSLNRGQQTNIGQTSGSHNSILVLDANGEYHVYYDIISDTISVTYPFNNEYPTLLWYDHYEQCYMPRLLKLADGMTSFEAEFTNIVHPAIIKIYNPLQQVEYYLSDTIEDLGEAEVVTNVTTSFSACSMGIVDHIYVKLDINSLCLVIQNLALTTTDQALYLCPNSNWLSSDARFAVYLIGSDSWVDLTLADTAPTYVYKCVLDQDVISSGIIFCRMNPNTSENNWNNKWNQTGDLIIPEDKNCCYINEGQWDCGQEVTWSYYSTDRYIAGNAALVGEDRAWQERNQSLKMSYGGSDVLYTITLDNVPGQVECKFKITNGSWDVCWGGSDLTDIDNVLSDADGNAVFVLAEEGQVEIRTSGYGGITLQTSSSFIPLSIN